MLVLRSLVAFSLLFVTSGCCLMLGNSQVAKTVEKGTAELGLTFGSTSYQIEQQKAFFDDPDTPEDETEETEGVTYSYPVILPEIPFGVAVTDDVMIGGRIAPQSLGLEANVKWRFLHADKLHMAILPSVHYQSWLLVSGSGFRLPLLVTYDVNDNFSFTTSVHGSYTSWDFADEEFDPDDAEDEDEGQLVWNGGLAAFGMGAGVSIHGETFFFRPTFEFNRYQSNLDDEFEESFEPFNSFGVMITVGFVIGRTKQQLDRIERKIDNLQPQPAPAPAPQPPPAPQGQEASLAPGNGTFLFPQTEEGGS